MGRGNRKEAVAKAVLTNVAGLSLLMALQPSDKSAKRGNRKEAVAKAVPTHVAGLGFLLERKKRIQTPRKVSPRKFSPKLLHDPVRMLACRLPKVPSLLPQCCRTV